MAVSLHCDGYKVGIRCTKETVANCTCSHPGICLDSQQLALYTAAQHSFKKISSFRTTWFHLASPRFIQLSN